MPMVLVKMLTLSLRWPQREMATQGVARQASQGGGGNAERDAHRRGGDGRRSTALTAAAYAAADASLCSRSLSSANALLLIASTASKPSLPLTALSLKRDTPNSSILFFILCQPPQSAVMRASCSKVVVVVLNGLYTTVSWQVMNSFQVKFQLTMVTVLRAGST